MSIEKDIKEIMEADIFKPVSKKELSSREAAKRKAYDSVNKDAVVNALNDALEASFSAYGWDDLIDNALIDFSDIEREWAHEHTTFKVVSVDVPGGTNESKGTEGEGIFKSAPKEEVEKRKTDRQKKFEASRKEYLESPDFCPYCGGTNIQAKEEIPDYGSIVQEVECEDCGETWDEIYELKDIDMGSEL